jgi:polysaccharide biosynthesis transport protein
MNFKQFLAIIRARWLIFLGVLSLVIGGTLLISLLLPKSYSASASVVIDVKPDPLGGLLGSGGLTPAMVETQIDIIQSDRVASRVVRNLKLNENPQTRAQWKETTEGQGDFELWLSETLQRNLEARPSRASGVVTITYKSPDAKFATALANAFAAAYLQVALELRVDPARQYSSFFDSRVKDARENLERVQAKASAYQRENNIISIDERFDVETSRLNELSTQLVMLQAQAAESNIRQTQAQSTSGDKMQEVLNNPVISSLKADLSRSEVRLQEMSSRFGENHPAMVEAKASVAEIKARLDAEVRRVVGGVGVTNTISRQRENELRIALETQRAKVLKLKAIRDEGILLLRDAENSQRLFEQMSARSNQSSVESQTNQTNITILSEARAPSRASSPRVLLNTALGSILGLALAIAVALGVEAVDRRVRLPSDIFDALGLPIIGSIPAPSSRLLSGNGNSNMKRRLLASSPQVSRSAS